MPDKTCSSDLKSATDWSAFVALTDDEVIAAALTDPDNPPMTDEELARLRGVVP